MFFYYKRIIFFFKYYLHLNFPIEFAIDLILSYYWAWDINN